MGKVAQGGSDLVDLFHARAHGAATDEYDNVAGLDFSVLDGADDGTFGGEDFGGAGLAVNAVRVHDAGVDARALDDGTLRGEVAAGEGDGAGKPARPRRLGSH